MTPHKQSEIWFEQAVWDIRAAKMSIDNHFYEWACFESEQAAEKAIKAAIVENGERPPRNHKLSSLIGMIKEVDKRIANIYFDVRTLQVFTFVARYPFLIPDENHSPHDLITIKDAQKCINQAQAILETLQNFYRN